MNILGTDSLRSQRFYHGTRAHLKPGDLIEPCDPPGSGEPALTTTYVYLTPNLDAAIWGAELAVGEGPSRVYIVEPVGQIEDVPELTHQNPLVHPSMSCRSRKPLRVTGEITEWPFYHGTRADLEAGRPNRAGPYR